MKRARKTVRYISRTGTPAKKEGSNKSKKA